MAIERAVQHVLQHGPHMADRGGNASAEQVTQAVIEQTEYQQHLDLMSGGSA